MGIEDSETPAAIRVRMRVDGSPDGGSRMKILHVYNQHRSGGGATAATQATIALTREAASDVAVLTYKSSELPSGPLGHLTAGWSAFTGGSARRDFIEAQWLMLQQPEPEDFVIATGVQHSVRDFCEIAFGEAGLDYREHVVQDAAFFRPADPTTMVADARLAAERLAWHPAVSFEAMVREMARADLERVRRSAT